MPDIEKIKREGVNLNLNQIAWQGYGAVKPDDFYRLKTLGVCGQRNAVGETYFFLRVKVPFGQVKPVQLQTLADLTERYGRGWGHLTTRQGIEIHSVQLEDIPTIFAELEKVGLTTKASCGDTIRNVVTCAHTGETPVALTNCNGKKTSGPLFDVRPWALLVQNHFLELGPENLNLPRKMNVYLTGCPNCIGHARINDLGLVGTVRRKADGGYEPGFALWVGGGLGANPRLAHQLRAFLAFDEVLPALEAVVRLYMDNGSRRSRAGAKLKFLIEEWGMGRFNSEFERYFAEIKPRFQMVNLPRQTLPKKSNIIELKRNGSFRNRTDQKTEISVNIEGGEIKSEQLRALADLVNLFGEGYAYFTKEQNICFKNLDADEAIRLEIALEAAGFNVEGAGRIDDVLSCPGTAFCQIAVTPSLNTASQLRKQLHQLIRDKHLPHEAQKLRIHISGCPNSCAQHQIADIGLAGTRVHTRTPGQSGFGYQLFLGGNLESTGRLGLLVHHGIPEEEIYTTIEEILHYYVQERQPSENFSSYVQRIGQEQWEQRLQPTTMLVQV